MTAAPRYPLHRPASSVPASPDLPAIEKRRARVLEGGRHLPGVDRRPRGRGERRSEWVFYDGPPFANGLPHYGHLLTGYAKDVVPALPDDARQAGRPPLRLGHPRPARRARGERQLGITDKAEIEEMGIAAFNAAARESVLRVHARVAGLRHPPGALGRLRARLQDARHRPTWSRVLWAFKTLHDKGLAYEGYRVLPYCWRDETPLSNHELRMDDDVYKMRQDPSVTVTFPLVGEGRGARLTACARSPGRRPRGPCRPTSRSPSAPTSTTRWSRARPAPPTCTASPRTSLAPSRRGSPRDYAQGPRLRTPRCGRRHRLHSGARARGRQLRPRSSTTTPTPRRGAPGRLAILVDDYVTTDDGTGIVHQAPAYGEDDQRVSEAAGIPVIIPVDDGGRSSPQVPDVAGAAGVRRQQAAHRGPRARTAGRLLRQRELRALLPALLALPQPADLQGRLELVRAGDRVQRPDGRAQPADHLGARERQGRPVRQVARQRPRLVDQPQPLLGLARSRCGRATTRAYPRVDVYGSLAELEARLRPLPRTRRRADLHRPYIDELTRPNPDDPTGRSTMRRIQDVLDVWFDSGLDAVRAGALPVREPRLVRAPLPGRLHRRVHRPDPRLVLHAARPVDGAVRPARRSRTCISHGIVLGSDGQKMSKSLRNYPDVNEVFDRDGVGCDALVPDVEPGAARRQPRRHRGGHPRGRAPGAAAAVEHLVLLLPVRERRRRSRTAKPERHGDRRSTCSTATCSRKTRDLVDASPRDLDALDSPLAAARAARLRRRAHQLVRPPLARPVLGGRRRAGDSRRGVRHPVHRARDAHPGRRTAAAARHRGDLAGLTGGRSVHLDRLAGRGRRSPRTTALVERDGPGPRRQLDRARRCASRRAARAAAAARRSPSSAHDADALRAVRRHPARRAQRQGGRRSSSCRRQRRRRYGITQRLTVNARAAGPRLGKRVQRVIQAARAGDWRVDGDTVVVTTDDGDARARAQASTSSRRSSAPRVAAAAAAARRRLRPARH